MARSIFFILLVVGLAACGNEDQDASSNSSSTPVAEQAAPQTAEATESRRPSRYSVRDGHITYKYEGLQEGTEEVYFTDYGMIEIKFTKTVRENPFKQGYEKIELTTLMRDTAIYVVDNTTMNARRIDNSLLYESALESASLDLNEVAEQMFRQKGGTIVDTQMIAGVPAEKWRIPQANTTEWRWNGIMMKTMVELPRSMVKVEAVSIDTTSPLPEGIFELPVDVNIQEGMGMKEWIEAVTKPIERKNYFDREGNTISRDSFRRIK